MTNKVTVDLDDLGAQTLWACVQQLQEQALFLQFCCSQCEVDPDAYKWADRLKEAANALRKYGEIDSHGSLMTEGDQ